ncbi:MAG: hypothetical protein KDK37_15790 [Leptospiraceae bacterium]|nr:hypothetical protein [Leptospiraceae bacterium]
MIHRIRILLLAVLSAACLMGAGPVLASPLETSLSVEAADLTYLGKDQAGQPIYATVSYTDGKLAFYTIATDGIRSPGFSVTYFDGKDFNRKILEEKRNAIYMPMGNGSPREGVPSDNISIRISGSVQVNRAGSYSFITRSDDGVRLRIDGKLVIDQWRPMGITEYSATLSLTPGVHSVQLEYFEQGGGAHLELLWKRPNQDIASLLATTGSLTSTSLMVRDNSGMVGDWKADYFKGKLESPLMSRSESLIDYDLSRKDYARGLPDSNFSARWTGTLRIDRPGRYRFYTTSDDGVRLMVNGQYLIDEWRGMAPTEFSGSVDLQPGQYPVVLEYFQGGGGARILLEWEGPSQGRKPLAASDGFASWLPEGEFSFVRGFVSHLNPVGDSVAVLGISSGGLNTTVDLLAIGAAKPSMPAQIEGSAALMYVDGAAGQWKYDDGALWKWSDNNWARMQDMKKPLQLCSSGLALLEDGYSVSGGEIKEYPFQVEGELHLADCQADEALFMGSNLQKARYQAGRWVPLWTAELPEKLQGMGQHSLQSRDFQFLGGNRFVVGNGLFERTGKGIEELYASSGPLRCSQGPQLVCLDVAEGKLLLWTSLR